MSIHRTLLPVAAAAAIAACKPSAPVAPAPQGGREVRGEAVREKIPLTGYAPPAIAFASDADFFAALDLDFPGLEKVRAAVAANDYPAAEKAFAAHLRAREMPVFVAEGKRVLPAGNPSQTDRRMPAGSMAEQALAHDYQIAGIKHKFNGPIQWDLNPTTQPGYRGAWSGQFHTQLNRMHHWRELAEAFRETGNAAYRDELLAQMHAWIRDVPPPSLAEVPAHIRRYLAGGGNVREHKLWLPLDTGMRATNMARVLETMRRTDGVGDRTLVDLAKSLGAHARLLVQLPIDGNHLAIATAGLANVATMLPEFKDSIAWLEEAVARVRVETTKQFYPDGAQKELTPWYHYTALRNFVMVLEMATANGHALPAELVGRFEKMFEYCVAISDPEGHAPPLNDSEYLDAAGVARRALDFFPQNAAFRHLASRGAEGRPPPFLSLALPYAGQAVLRSGWGKQDLFLLMEYGPFGTGHMHEDKLGLIATAYSRRLLVDPGRNKYEASAFRDYSVNAGAHSTVLFDGLFQARRLAGRELGATERPVPVVWQTGADADYVVGAYGADEREVFALPTDPPGNVAPEWFRLVMDERWRESDVQTTRRMVQRRHVLFVKPHYWVVVDTFDPLDTAGHDYTSLFQLGDGQTAVEQLTLFLGAPGEAGMALACSAADPAATLSVARGQQEPFLSGWTFSDGEPSPAPTARFRFRADGPTAAAYAIVPHPAGGTPARPRIEWLPGPDTGARAIRVDPGDGRPPVTLSLPGDGAGGTWRIGA